MERSAVPLLVFLVASLLVLCHNRTHSDVAFPFPAFIQASNEIKKLKFEKTWHMTDKDSKITSNSRSADTTFLFIRISLFGGGNSSQTRHFLFVKHSSVQVHVCLCVRLNPVLAKVVFFSSFFSFVHLSIESHWQTNTRKNKKESSINHGQTMTLIYWLHLIFTAIEEMAMTPPPTTQLRIRWHNSGASAQSKISFRTTLIALKQTNNEIVTSKIDRRSHRTKTAQKSWSHEHVTEMIIHVLLDGRLCLSLCAARKTVRQDENVRENYGMPNAATVAATLEFIVITQKRDANDFTFVVQTRIVKKKKIGPR